MVLVSVATSFVLWRSFHVADFLFFSLSVKEKFTFLRNSRDLTCNFKPSHGNPMVVFVSCKVVRIVEMFACL